MASAWSPCVGDRVVVGAALDAGEVRFLGKTKFSSGVWAGVHLFRPLGRHDGCIAGVRYFNSSPGHGIFVRPGALSRVGVAAWPERERQERANGPMDVDGPAAGEVDPRVAAFERTMERGFDRNLEHTLRQVGRQGPHDYVGPSADVAERVDLLERSVTYEYVGPPADVAERVELLERSVESLHQRLRGGRWPEISSKATEESEPIDGALAEVRSSLARLTMLASILQADARSLLARAEKACAQLGERSAVAKWLDGVTASLRDICEALEASKDALKPQSAEVAPLVIPELADATNSTELGQHGASGMDQKAAVEVVSAQVHLGAILFMKGDHEGAEKAFRGALAGSPAKQIASQGATLATATTEGIDENVPPTVAARSNGVGDRVSGGNRVGAGVNVGESSEDDDDASPPVLITKASVLPTLIADPREASSEEEEEQETVVFPQNAKVAFGHGSRPRATPAPVRGAVGPVGYFGEESSDEEDAPAEGDAKAAPPPRASPVKSAMKTSLGPSPVRSGPAAGYTSSSDG